MIAAFEHMRFKHPRIPEVHTKLDDAREAGRLTPRSPKRYIEFFAPSHSGKSMAIRTYIEDRVVDEAIERGLVPADMNKTSSTEVTDTLKTMMIRGLVPMVFVGVPEAREHLAIDAQLTNREMDKIDFSPLRWSDEKDAGIFLEYCIEAARGLTEYNLLPEETDLLEGDIAEKLWAASGGCIGVVSRILEQAVFHALDRNATKVEYEDLQMAVDTRAIPNNMSTYNPFAVGVLSVDLAETTEAA